MRAVMPLPPAMRMTVSKAASSRRMPPYGPSRNALYVWKGPFSMAVKSAKVTDYSTGKQYKWGDMSGTWQSIVAVDGKINGNAGSKGSAPTLTATAVPGQLKYSCVGREEVEGGHVSKRKRRWKWRVWRGRQFPRIGCPARGALYGMVSIDCQVGMQ